uniref:Uncharacterized protein n=1 Tax=Rubinisphaera brasiliensis (strain ATCC 49424 / DSM 5305 / JCM 21570 / IAM 15109 / NBRC 103401 / IFAM 1448) TaxID=756272 RepID=F0SMX7_RUBBR|nr:hypothetical protein Plabr_2380 [Rubinisphaera brasiliensis DSM 5305]
MTILGEQRAQWNYVLCGVFGGPVVSEMLVKQIGKIR